MHVTRICTAQPACAATSPRARQNRQLCATAWIAGRLSDPQLPAQSIDPAWQLSHLNPTVDAMTLSTLPHINTPRPPTSSLALRDVP